jgi:hypothetical protein
MRFILWECDRCHITAQTNDVPGGGPQPHGWEILLREAGGATGEFHLCPDCASGTREERKSRRG